MATIGIRDLVVGYGQTPVISGLSLDVPDGQLFTLLGPSGCGKTTLLRTIAGFIPVRSGKLLFGERNVTELPAHKRDIGMVFQDYALFPDKSVFDNVAYGLRARRKDAETIRRTVGEYLERVGLSGFTERLPAALSGGQRQRVALARALAIKPAVLLMDEPLSNLDAKLRVQVRETIADLQREVGITTVFVTHDQEEALALSDGIGLMRSGKLEQVGTPREIYERPASAYVADFVGAANTLAVVLPSPASADSRTTANFEGRSLAVTASAALPAGPAMLIARAEALRLASGVDGVPNCVAGTLRRAQYLGARTHHQIVTEGGQIVMVESQGAAHAAFRPGDRVNVVFDPDQTLVVAS
jgi:iron(III) transport system ATP-binding protein